MSPIPIHHPTTSYLFFTVPVPPILPSEGNPNKPPTIPSSAPKANLYEGTIFSSQFRPIQPNILKPRPNRNTYPPHKYPASIESAVSDASESRLYPTFIADPPSPDSSYSPSASSARKSTSSYTDDNYPSLFASYLYSIIPKDFFYLLILNSTGQAM